MGLRAGLHVGLRVGMHVGLRYGLRHGLRIGLVIGMYQTANAGSVVPAKSLDDPSRASKEVPASDPDLDAAAAVAPASVLCLILLKENPQA